MTVKFISFLGTNKYQPCQYELNQFQSTPTPYVQEAIVDLLAKQNIFIEEAHMLLTPQARNENWEGDGKLLEALSRFPQLNIKEHNISSEQSFENIWDLFETMIGIFEEQDHVIFDITHSFRFQPMLALLAIHFARVVKSLHVDGIYYGAFGRNSQIAPILDLTSFVELQDWITNVYALSKTGRADVLTDWLKSKDQSIRRDERKTTIDLKYIRKLADHWNNLTSALETNRSTYLPEKANDAIQSIKEIKQVMLRPVFLPLNVLLTDMEEKIKPMTAEDPVVSGIAAVEWCAHHGLFQQAYTMAAELIFTAVCIKNGYDIKKREERKQGSALITTAVKIQQNGMVDEYEQLNEKERHAVDELLKYPDLLNVTNLLTDYRNDINHAGWRPNPLKANIFKTQYEKWYPTLKSELLKYYHSTVLN